MKSSRQRAGLLARRQRGSVEDAERRVRPSHELREEELARPERRLTPVIARGEAALERLAAEELRRLHEPGERQFAEQDPDASRALAAGIGGRFACSGSGDV
jgi:hypothetical protein